MEKHRTAEFTPINAGGAVLPWRVRATLPSGRTKEIGEFENEAAAQKWIRLVSAQWLGLMQCEASLAKTDRATSP